MHFAGPPSGDASGQHATFNSLPTGLTRFQCGPCNPAQHSNHVPRGSRADLAQTIETAHRLSEHMSGTRLPLGAPAWKVVTPNAVVDRARPRAPSTEVDVVERVRLESQIQVFGKKLVVRLNVIGHRTPHHGITSVHTQPCALRWPIRLTYGF